MLVAFWDSEGRALLPAERHKQRSGCEVMAFALGTEDKVLQDTRRRDLDCIPRQLAFILQQVHGSFLGIYSIFT